MSKLNHHAHIASLSYVATTITDSFSRSFVRAPGKHSKFDTMHEDAHLANDCYRRNGEKVPVHA